MNAPVGRGVLPMAVGLAVLIGATACGTIRPEVAACDEITTAAARLPSTTVRQRADSFPDFRGATRQGCVVDISGPLDAESPVPVLVTTFADSLGDGWMRDDTMVADGPATTVYGLWRGEILCTFRVDWGEQEPVADRPRAAGQAYVASAGCAPTSGSGSTTSDHP